MRRTILVLAALVGIGLTAPPPMTAQGPPDHAQGQKAKDDRTRTQERGNAQKPDKARGQGQGQTRGQAGGQGQARGQARDKQGGPPAHARARRGGPAPDRAVYNRNLVEKAVRTRGRRNAGGGNVDFRRENGEVRLVRDDGAVLFSLREDVVDDLGYWRMAVAPRFGEVRPDRDPNRDRDRDGGVIFGDPRYDYEDEEGAPSFCRSGEGHPVWGREWCVDKGFGLSDRGSVWGRATDLDDVIFRRPRTDRTDLDRGGLIDVLGDVVFGRLALQSLVLGADQPLTGSWLGQDDGPRVLRVHAGGLPVAELVDGDRDDDVDVMVVNLGT